MRLLINDKEIEFLKGGTIVSHQLIVTDESGNETIFTIELEYKKNK